MPRFSSMANSLHVLFPPAYFQASGMGKLLGALLAPSSLVPPSRGVVPLFTPSRDGDILE